MEVDDFVETSDVEELQELDDEGPRKRLKLYHETLSDDEINLEDDSSEPPEVIQEQPLDGPRYSLRRREVAQLKPYTVDQLKYKQALRANPDAIVKFKDLALRSHHYHPEDRYEEDGETQVDHHPHRSKYKKALRANPDSVVKLKDLALRSHYYHPEDLYEEDGETQTDHHPHRSKYKQALRANPDAIVEFKDFALRSHHYHPEDRYEEDGETQVDHPQSKQRDSHSSDISDIEIQLPRSKQRALARTPKSMAFAQATTSSTPSASGSDDDEDPLLPDLTQLPRSKQCALARMLPKSMALALVKQATTSSTPPGSGSGSDDDEDPLLSGSIQLPRSKQRALARMLPKSMALALVKQAATSSTSSACSSEDDEGPLVPSQQDQIKPKKKKQERIIPGDLGIPILHSGKSFGLSTSIRKGWLHELLGLVTSAQEPVLPPSTNSCGFELVPTMGADKLVSILQDICSTLFEFVTDLPDVDSDTTIKGAAIMRVVPLLISWFSKTEDEGVCASLREAGEREIAWLVAKIQKLTLPFVDMPILATCWFAVEMSARLGCRLEGQPPTGILKESAMTLIHLLLQVGLEKPITIVKSDTDMTESSVPHFAAELWVSLIHLLGECDSLEKANRRIHPFWLLLMTAIQSRPEVQKPGTNLEASETIWYTIFSVCALSQYSVHGMTTGMPRLPACWDLVVFALKKIRLNEDPKTDLGMPSAMLLQRDKYIGLVMTRCFHLRERWRWKLDDASILFNQLAVIFRSRKFVNLRHEGTGYPKFFKDRNWDLLASYDPKDTAFVLFLKLIVQAAKDDQGSIPGKLSLKAKKLLSLAIPVASLPFSKTNPPTLRELTMFHNRLSAVAIAVYLELDEYDFRTRQAREYIKFADADDTTRSVVIDGMMNWAIMMVNREIKLDAITTWIGEMSQVLSVELKETSLNITADELNKANSLRRDRLVLLSCVLLGAVRHILTAYSGLGRYPEPSLLLSLRPIMHSLFNKEDSQAQGELGLLTDSFFSARSAAMPPPDRPVRVPARVVDEDNGEESQDYGVMDIEINWASVDIPEALAVDNEEKSLSNNASHDKALVSILASLGFRWIMYRFLKPYLVPLPPSASFQVYAKQCDMWLRCAVGCTCIEIGDRKWDFWFRILDPHFTQVDDRWVRRVKLSLMLKILRADPMAYLTYTDRFIDVYLHALGSDSTILEKDYVPFLLSIDNLQHPLLCNTQCLPERSQESGDYEFTVERFLELRLPLLRVVFSNLDRLLREQHAGNIALRIDNSQYLAKCREVFSVMRSNRASLEGTKHYSNYNDFCIKVFQSLQEYPTLRVAENISFWVDLGRV